MLFVVAVVLAADTADTAADVDDAVSVSVPGGGSVVAVAVVVVVSEVFPFPSADSVEKIAVVPFGVADVV